jgi:hypothetical protein
VDSSHANLLLAVGCGDLVGVGVGVSADRVGLSLRAPVSDEPRLKRLAIMVPRPSSSASLSSSESYSSPDSDPDSDSEYSLGGDTPSLTGAEEPLNQLCRALTLGCDALDSAAPREGMKLASDLEGECERNDALEVCCWSVVEARARKGWQLSIRVLVRVRWWLLRGERG